MSALSEALDNAKGWEAEIRRLGTVQGGDQAEWHEAFDNAVWQRDHWRKEVERLDDERAARKAGAQ